MNAVSIYRTPAGEQTVMRLYDDALRHWAVPYQTQQIITRHAATFVITCGSASAPPLVLLHGAGSNSSIWAGDAAEYSRHFRIYAVDLPGEPGKSAPVYLTWNGSTWAEWLDDVFDALNIDRAVIAGISQGAFTALKFAVARPECVVRLILITPGGIVPDRLSGVVKAVFWSLFGRRGRKQLMRLLVANESIPESIIDRQIEVMTHFKPRFGVLPIFSDADMLRLTMPVLLLGGTADILRDTVKIAARMRAHVTNLTVKQHPGAGHVLVSTVGDVKAFLGIG